MSAARAKALSEHAEAIFGTRCAVCHGCYDAPCQLKLDSFEGVARGASGRPVYDATRLIAADPTRLFVDARGAAAWRGKGFHPVLPEGNAADPRSSLLVRMLELKRAHPPVAGAPLDPAITLGLDREQRCETGDDWDAFERDHPLWGMPYGMPALSAEEHEALIDWVSAGAPAAPQRPLSAKLTEAVEGFERFLDQPSDKARLMARYIYEHLFLATLYFDEVERTSSFRLVRSRTPTGSPIDEIATRRPHDDPETARFYYRLAPQVGPALAKTRMPYALNDARLRRYRELFLEPEYPVGPLPSYEPKVAANPFVAFAQLPVGARYRFLLDDAEFVLQGFIKGPVCRGQVALNVIQDRFWVVFVDPDAPWAQEAAGFLAAVRDKLDLPADAGSNALLTSWMWYAVEHAKYVEHKNAFLQRASRGGKALDLDAIWDGGGHNSNAALTVLRHFDSASVVRGLVGGPPKTAWVMDYAQLERIHYLLVAGFDVFGNVGHQLLTRLYMDFLRMEGEANFLALLPPAARGRLVKFWYRGTKPEQLKSVWQELLSYPGFARIRYRTQRPERELFAMLEQRLANVRSRRYDLTAIDPSLAAHLRRLGDVRGAAASQMPETAFVSLHDEGADAVSSQFSVLRESAHTNVTQLFQEESRRREQEDGLTVLPGLVGAYPNALFALTRAQLPDFISAVERLRSPADFAALHQHYGVSRTDPTFWQHSDRLHRAYRKENAPDTGLLDYNRLDRF